MGISAISVLAPCGRKSNDEVEASTNRVNIASSSSSYDDVYPLAYPWSKGEEYTFGYNDYTPHEAKKNGH